MAVTAQGSGTWTDRKGSSVTAVSATDLLTVTSSNFAAGDKVVLQASGSMPTGLSAGTTYYVISANLTANDFQLAATEGGAAIDLTSSGSGVTVTNVEHIVVDSASAGTYTFHIDANTLASGDVLEFRIYQMVLTGGTRRVAYYARFDGAQPSDDQIKISVPISNELTDSGALRFTIKQPYGTAHAYPWKVLRYA